MFPLTMAKVGEKGQMKRISGKDEVKVHLAELGFVVNNEVTVVNRMGDNLIVQVHDSRIAIDSTLAKRIFIQGDEEDDFKRSANWQQRDN